MHGAWNRCLLGHVYMATHPPAGPHVHTAVTCMWVTAVHKGQMKETHRLVGLKQNMELYGTMGRGPLLIPSSASASFFPSAWLSRST